MTFGLHLSHPFVDLLKHTKQFEEATAAAAAGDLSKAVAEGNAVKEKGMQVAAALGLQQN